MRAAFVAAQAGKQVAVLVPTTLLAQQHTNNFRDRFADWPVRIESLSRFRTRQGDAKPCCEGLERGTVDIVIGTHRLLQPDVQFKDLGPDHRRRGAPLRCARQGKAEDAARRGGRADAHRHADPAHAEHGHGRSARAVADHDAAGRAPGDQDLRHRVGRARPCAKPRCARFRRGGQVYYVHNVVETIDKTARGARRSSIPEADVAHRPWPDARARARAAHARFLPPALQPAGLHDHHRERHRRAHGQHHHHRPRRPAGSRAAAPAARPRRPLASPRLCLPADAEPQGAVAGCGETPGSHRVARKTSAPASCWPRTIWKSAAPASC